MTGTILAYLVSFVTFWAAWWYSTASYGFVIGFGFGWVPSLILSGMVWAFVRWLWPLPVAGFVALAFAAFS